jgi:hypothetical protein
MAALTKFQKGAPIPDEIGARADLLHEVREVRKMMQKETDEVKARETEIETSIINDLPKSSKGVAGLRYFVKVVPERRPQVTDWPAFHAYVIDNARTDLLQKRLSDRAVMDMYEAGELPPGLDTVLIPKISLTKV